MKTKSFSITSQAIDSKVGRIRMFVLLSLSFLLIAADSPGDASKKVNEGLQLFRNNQFSEAETAFAEAGEISPENSIILFDEACAALAGNDAEQARGLFRKASLAKDAALAVKAHYNLGCLEADQARLKLGEDPAAAEGETREESINMLLTSIRSYRDVLRLETAHKDARHNIELIRLYIKHLQSQWAERDKQKARDEKDLLQFLQMIEDRQTQLRTTTKALSDEQDTAYLRQAVMETSESLRTLYEEIEPLKQKISQQIQQPDAASAGGPPQPGGNQPGSTQPDAQAGQMQQAEQLLHQMADQIGERMLQAATELDSKKMDAAVSVETEGLDQTNQLYMAIAPYQEVLQRAISEQSKLLPNEQAVVDETDAAKQPPAEADTTEAAVADNAVDDTDTDTVAPAKDFVQLAENQSRITDWSDVLSLKAESELPAAEQQLEALKQSLPPSEEVPAKEISEAKGEPDAAPDSNIDTNADHSLPEKSATDAIEESSQEQPELTDEQKAAKAQQEQVQKQVAQLTGLVESMRMAIDLAPQAATHSDNASKNLAAKDSDSAMPEQKEADRILKEIAEPLVSENQDNQQDNQEQQQNEDQDNKDQNQDDQKDGDKEQQKRDEQNKQQEQDKPPDDKQQQQKEQQEQKDQQQQQTQQEQAESTLRKAREREREHLEKQKQIRALLQRGIKVDRDW